MISAAVKDDNRAKSILVCPDPTTKTDAKDNLLAFSDEARNQVRSAASQTEFIGLVSITSVPRLRKCFGWMKFTGEELYERLPRKLWPPQIKIEKRNLSIKDEKLYTAVVYEFIPNGENKEEDVQQSLDFFQLAGFSFTPTLLLRNWKMGVLLDMSDIAYAWGDGWLARRYKKRTLENVR